MRPGHHPNTRQRCGSSLQLRPLPGMVMTWFFFFTLVWILVLTPAPVALFCDAQNTGIHML